MVLLIDWGNTFLKFILLDRPTFDAITINESAISTLSEPFEQVAGVAALTPFLNSQIELCLVSSVRNEVDNQQLRSLLQSINSKIFFAHTSAAACGVSCAYSQPKTLGVDRWLAIIAVANENETIGVVDIGSAITLDVVRNNQHLGGQILPGKQLMLASLQQTGQVRANFQASNDYELQLGTSTSDCVNLAIDSAIASYLNSGCRQLEQKYYIDRWVITGGGAHDWQSCLQKTLRCIELRPGLIFEGLVKLYLEQAER